MPPSQTKWRYIQPLAKYESLLEKMVLPRRIELRTSPLPRGCSTTELRQHRGPGSRGPKAKARGWPLASGAEHATLVPVRQPEAARGGIGRFSCLLRLFRAVVDRSGGGRHMNGRSQDTLF